MSKSVDKIRVAFDFETYEWVNPLCCGFAFPGGAEIFIHDEKDPHKVSDDALLFMLNHPEIEFWAHNMGRFDGLFLSASAKRLGIQQSVVLAGSRPVKWSFTRDGKTVHCCDSFALVPDKLSKAAIDFDLPSRKLLTDEEYKTDARTWEFKRLHDGCMTDCKLVLELLDKLEALAIEWNGSLGITFSSTALRSVKGFLKKEGIKLPQHKGEKKLWINDFARKGYYGGRIEVLTHKPIDRLTEWDVNSSYPWAMAQTLPWEPLGTATPAGIDSILCGTYEGVIEAKVAVPSDMEFPPLPFKPDSGGLYFPTGEWTAHFAAPDLRYAMQLGCTVRPIAAVLYSGESHFQAFIDEVYHIKNTTKGAQRSFAKGVLCGCYGKFSQKPEFESLKFFTTIEESFAFTHDAPDGTCQPLGKDCRDLIVKGYRWPSHSHFAMGAYITAYARIKLHKAMVASKGLCYVDSDSIHAVTFPGADVSAKLGDWKIELTDYLGEYYAPKIYRLHTRDKKEVLACKGFPVNHDSFERLIKGEVVTRERMRLIKSQGRKSPDKVSRAVDAKRWLGHSAKRHARANGHTRPWTVAELRAGKHEEQMSPWR